MSIPYGSTGTGLVKRPVQRKRFYRCVYCGHVETPEKRRKDAFCSGCGSSQFDIIEKVAE